MLASRHASWSSSTGTARRCTLLWRRSAWPPGLCPRPARVPRCPPPLPPPPNPARIPAPLLQGRPLAWQSVICRNFYLHARALHLVLHHRDWRFIAGASALRYLMKVRCPAYPEKCPPGIHCNDYVLLPLPTAPNMLAHKHESNCLLRGRLMSAKCCRLFHPHQAWLSAKRFSVRLFVRAGGEDDSPMIFRLHLC